MPIDWSKYGIDEEKKSTSRVDWSKYAPKPMSPEMQKFTKKSALQSRESMLGALDRFKPTDVSAEEPRNGPLYIADDAGKDRSKDKSRNIPVIGPLLKGLDWVANKTLPATEVAGAFYTPGAGVANVSSFAKAAETGATRLIPKLAGSSPVKRIALESIKEGSLGAPINATHAASQGASNKDIVKEAAIGADIGAGFGIAGQGIRGLMQVYRNTPKQQLKQSVKDFIQRTEQSPTINHPSDRLTLAGVQAMKVVSKEVPPSTTSIEKPARTTTADAQNYAGNQFPFREAPTQTDRTIARNQVVKNLGKNLDVVIDTGRLTTRSKSVLGQYKISPEVVRSRMAEDLQVISHEIGHHFDKKYQLQNPLFRKEMMDVVKANDMLDVSAYKPSELQGEGIAEYVRLRLTDPEKARQIAPEFTKAFDSKLPPKILKGLEASQRDVDTWITQGEFEQAKGLIDFTSGSEKKPFSFDEAYTKYVDDLNPLKLAEKALKGAVGIGKESIYKMARLSRGIGEKAKLAVTRGIYDSQGNKMSEGLREIVKPLEKVGVSEKDFATYLSVLHAKDLAAMGKKIPFTEGQMSAVLKRLDTPEVRAVQQGIKKYNDSILEILVDAQILSREAVQDMQKKYPNYVPFMRYFDDDAVAGFKNGGFGAAKAFANISSPIKRMSEEGSTRTIINPIESIVKNTFLAMNAAAKNKVGLQLAKLAKMEGAGVWVEHVGKGGASPHEHVVSVWENGVKQSYKVRNPELYNAMLSLDAESTNSLMKFLGSFASVLRAGATLTPEFTVRNAIRDVAEATVNSSKYGFNPLDFFKGMYHVIGKTELFDKFLSTGGAMSTLQSLDRSANREAMKAIFRESLKDKTLNVITSPKELAKMLSGYTPAKTVIKGLRHAAEVSELSTKVGAFRKALNKTGSLEEAAFTARDLMDFNRAGSSIRQANRAIAFLNAQIQGADRIARSFKENPGGTAVRAFTTLVLPATLVYYWNKNLSEEQRKVFDNIPQWQKDNFFIVGIPGTKEFARIPKPFEMGMLFATGTERMLRWVEDNDPQAFKDYGAAVGESVTPPVLMTALTPLLEATTNHSFFRNAPIVPMGDQRFEKKDQYGIYTSEVAKGLGQALSHTPLKDSNFASPRIIDNTIRGYTAGLGQYAVSGADAIINAVKGGRNIPLPEKRLGESPFLRPFTANTSGGGQIRQDFYDEWDAVSKKKASADRNEEPFDDPVYAALKPAHTTISNLNTLYKQILNDKTLSPKDKRKQLDDLDQYMNDIAEKSLKAGGMR